MKQKHLLKSLLVAAGLCVGASAWADGNKRTLYSQDYESATASDWTSPNGAVSLATGDATYGNYAKTVSQGSGNRSCYTTLSLAFTPDEYATTALSTKGYVVEWDMKMRGGQQKDRSVGQFIVPTTDPSKFTANNSYTGAEYIFALSQPTNTSGSMEKTWYINDLSNASNSVTLENAWYHYTLVVTATSVNYTITKVGATEATATGSLTVTSIPTITGFWGLLGRSYGEIDFDNVDIYDYTATLTANAPTLTLKAVSGANRVYSLSNTNDGGTLYYTTAPADEAPAIGDAAYSSTTDASKDITYSEAGKYYAYAVLSDGTTTSTIAEVDVTVGEITLPTPTYAITGLDAGYAKTFTITAPNNVLLTPAVSLSYVFTPEGGSAQSAVTMTGNTINATEAGTYVVTSSAIGYTSASVTIENTTAYKLVKTIDFTVLTAADFDDKWTTATGGLDSRWASNASGIPSDATYYTLTNPATDGGSALDGITVTNPAQRQPQVYVGYGLFTPYTALSGNSNYMNLTVNDATEDQLAVFQGWNNYGKGTFTTVQLGNATFGLYRTDTMLKTIKLYAPITEEFVVVSVTDAGYATFCPDKNVDFSAADDIEACTAVVAADGNITYTVVNTVAAGEGVLLRTKSGGAASENLLVLDDATANENNAFVGIPEKVKLAQSTEVGYTNYILSKVDDVLGFYKVNSNGSWCNAGSAYLKVANAAAHARNFFALSGSETTAIEVVGTEATTSSLYYNLNGQRMAQPAKGIYVVNGKKVIIK